MQIPTPFQPREKISYQALAVVSICYIPAYTDETSSVQQEDPRARMYVWRVRPVTSGRSFSPPGSLSSSVTARAYRVWHGSEEVEETALESTPLRGRD